MNFNGGPIPVAPATSFENLNTIRYKMNNAVTGNQDRPLGTRSPLRVPRVRNHARQPEGAQEEDRSTLRSTDTVSFSPKDDPTTQAQDKILPTGSVTTASVEMGQGQAKLHRRIGTPNLPGPRSSLPKGFDPFPRSPPKATPASAVKVAADAPKDEMIHPSPVETDKKDDGTITQAGSAGNASPKTPPSGTAKPAADEATTPVVGKQALNPAVEFPFSPKPAAEPKDAPVEIITTAASPEPRGETTTAGATADLQDKEAHSRNASYHTAKTHQSSSPESSPPSLSTAAATNNSSKMKPKPRSSASSVSDDIQKPRARDSSFATNKILGGSSHEPSSSRSSSDKKPTIQVGSGDHHERALSGSSARSTGSKKSTKSMDKTIASPPESKTEDDGQKTKKNAAAAGGSGSSSSGSSPRTTIAVKRMSGERGREERTYAKPRGRDGETSKEKERSPPAFDMQNFPALPMARGEGAGANGVPKGA